MDKETPITKYLATLERRQAQRERQLLFGSPGAHTPGISPPNSRTVNIRQQLRFEDETFLQPHDQSLLPMSPPSQTKPNIHRPLLPAPTNAITATTPAFVTPITNNFPSRQGSSCSTEKDGKIMVSSGFKRKRYSFEDKEEQEDHIKKICELQKLLRQTNGELVEARAITAKLERQKMDLRTEGYEKSLNYEKSIAEMRVKCRDAVEKTEELQIDNEAKAKKLDELKEELRRQSSHQTEKLLALESKISLLQCENVELKNKFDEEKLNQSDSLKKLSVNLHESERGTEKWSLECQIMKDQLVLKDSQIKKYVEELKEAQSKICRSNSSIDKIQASEEDSESSSSETKILKLEEQVKKYENLYIKEQNENSRISKLCAKLSEENGYFKGCMNKEMLLEEHVSSLETEVKYLREVLTSKVDTEVERDNAKEKLSQWTGIAQNINVEYSNPQKFRVFLSQTQTDLFEMKHENTTLNCKVDILNREINKLQSELLTTKQAEKLKSDECGKLTAECKQLSRRVMLLTKDRDGLKSLKESYEQELEGIISSALKERVEQLEGLLKEYEEAISNGSVAAKKICFECDKRIALINQLRSELEKPRNLLEQSTFGDITMSGDTTKIVTFENNPSTLSMECRIKELCAENERLKERVKQLEDQSIMGASDTVTQGNRIVEEQLRILERKHQLLTEAYDYETQQLQTALSKLFGFHIILVKEPQPQFRLQSVYGSGSEDELIFQEAQNSDMMLLETPVLDHFREDIDRFLLREGSIPAFLATVTISFSQGLVQPSDASQMPSSQQSNATDSGDTVTINSTPHPGSRTIEVEVAGNNESDGEEEALEEEEDTEEEEHEGDYGDDDEEEDDGSDEGEGPEFREADEGEGNDVVCIDSD